MDTDCTALLITSDNLCQHFPARIADDSALISDERKLLPVSGSDLGAHIDGFIAVAAHSVLLQGDSSSPAEGQAADALQAANTALEAALRLIRPGKLISEVHYLLPAKLYSLREQPRKSKPQILQEDFQTCLSPLYRCLILILQSLYRLLGSCCRGLRSSRGIFSK